MKLKDSILEIKRENPNFSLRKIASLLGCNHTTVLKHLTNSHISCEKTDTHKPNRVSEILASKGLSVKDLEELLRPKGQRIKLQKPRTTNFYRLGVVSDTHLCDKACTLDELHEAYAWFKREGITDVVHAGDITAGQNVYRGQFNDLLAFGFDDQLVFCKKNYPLVEGITTYFISGNHCESFTTTAGAHFCEALAEKRSDLVFLGTYNAQIVLNGVKIELHHGAGGGSYALSYKLQRYVESMPAGKPQIYILGHYHSFCHLLARGIHCFLPMCFQGHNDFSKRLKLPNTRGAMILDMHIEDDDRHTIREIKVHRLCFYDER